MKQRKKIPVNVITGFLGVGKTISILRLLANKPAEEKWAVLVNEFGEIGIDGAIIEDSGIAIKEVMGGCFCCTYGGSVDNGLGMFSEILLHFVLTQVETPCR